MRGKKTKAEEKRAQKRDAISSAKAMQRVKYILYGFNVALFAIAAVALFAPYAEAQTIFVQSSIANQFNTVDASSPIGSFTPTADIDNTDFHAALYGGVSGTLTLAETAFEVCDAADCHNGNTFSYTDTRTTPRSPSYSQYDDTSSGTLFHAGTTYYVVPHEAHVGSGHTTTLGDSSNRMYVAMWSGSVPPSSGGGTTGIDAIGQPTLAATTSSPVAISFQYTISSSTMPFSDDRAYSEYRLVFTQPSSGAIITAFGTLDADDFGSFTQSTTTSLNGDGTWNLSVSLATPVQYGTRSYAARGAQTFFGLGFNDRPDVYAQYLPPQQSAYASSSCAISFAGTFDLPQCLGYLIVPTVGSSSPLNEIRNLSLKNTMPFAYVYQLGDIREALFNSSSTASTTLSFQVPGFGHSTSTITFLSAGMIEALPFTGTFRTIFGFLLWFMLAELIYYQVIRAHDTTTPTV